MNVSRLNSALLLCGFLGGCIDYVDVKGDLDLSGDLAFAPVINTKYLSPHPTLLTETINVGKNCRGVTFTVPPIKDLNRRDRLYYLWFIDSKLARHQSKIEPESRDSAIITFTIDDHFLLSHFESEIPTDFFNRPHVIEILVSDMEYTIPVRRDRDDAKNNEDYAYWIIWFSNNPC